MRPMAHGVAGVVLGGAVLAWTRDPGLALMTGGSTFLWDLDHAVEYLFHQGSRGASLSHFLGKGQAATWPRLVFLLHGYEWLAGLGVLAWAWASPELTMITLGGAVHLLMDEWGNRRPRNRHRIHALFYFFLFRLSRGFRSRDLAWWRPVETEEAR